MIKFSAIPCTILALAGPATVVAPAHADERPCVSRREYTHVLTTDNGHSEIGDSPGWRQARVADHFDLHGTRIRRESNRYGEVETLWKYRKCSAWGPGGLYVGISYNNWWGDGYMRVWQKSPNRPSTLWYG